jgi:hypothetical protein
VKAELAVPEAELDALEGELRAELAGDARLELLGEDDLREQVEGDDAEEDEEGAEQPDPGAPGLILVGGSLQQGLVSGGMTGLGAGRRRARQSTRLRPRAWRRKGAPGRSAAILLFLSTLAK